jgi:hypothetical protein
MHTYNITPDNRYKKDDVFPHLRCLSRWYRASVYAFEEEKAAYREALHLLFTGRAEECWTLLNAAREAGHARVERKKKDAREASLNARKEVKTKGKQKKTQAYDEDEENRLDFSNLQAYEGTSAVGAEYFEVSNETVTYDNPSSLEGRTGI